MIKLCRHQELTDQLTLHTPNGSVASVLRIKTSWGEWNQHSYVIWTPDIEPVEIHQSPGQGAGLTCASEFQYFPSICRTSAFPDALCPVHLLPGTGKSGLQVPQHVEDSCLGWLLVCCCSLLPMVPPEDTFYTRTFSHLCLPFSPFIYNHNFFDVSFLEKRGKK